jgi:hypothetical protein
MMKRIIYLGYYLKKIDKKKYLKFLNHTVQISDKSKFLLCWESVFCVFKYNISILEYFQFGFYNKSHDEREEWAGTGTMYEFQSIANPTSERNILDDKRLFYKKYKEFFSHSLFTFEELQNNEEVSKSLIQTSSKIVLKEASGNCGSGVVIMRTAGLTYEKLLDEMKSKKLDLLETFIDQHEDLQKLSPSAVNTIRIFTQIRRDNTFEILGCRMRISIDCEVDNLAAGNIAATIDKETGVITGLGVYSDITKLPEKIHPVTGVQIVGFQIPFWQEILKMVKKASLKHPQNRSIGWDVVVTKNGPGLIEGNHDWCKLVWQLPVNKGLKGMLDV